MELIQISHEANDNTVFLLYDAFEPNLRLVFGVAIGVGTLIYLVDYSGRLRPWFFGKP
jgi:hypothetical protein